MRRFLSIFPVFGVVFWLAPVLQGMTTMQVGPPSASYAVHVLGLRGEGWANYDAQPPCVVQPATGFDTLAHLYDDTRIEVWTKYDPEGLATWVEGPNPNEPAGHMSISVGDPVTGNYKSYSFGVISNDRPFSLKNGLQGTVYLDNSHGGKIDPNRYYYTTPEMDKYLQGEFDKNLAKNADGRYPYRIGDSSCRDWTNTQWDILDKEFQRTGAGVKGPPPVETAKDTVQKSQDQANSVVSGSTSSSRPSSNTVSKPTTDTSQPTTADHSVASGSSSTTTTSTRGSSATTAATTPSGEVGATATSTTAAGGVPSTSTNSSKDTNNNDQNGSQK